MFTHIVTFWTKKETPESSKAALMDDCLNLLSKIAGVKFITAGRPAMTPRDVVDNSYDVGLCVVLTDKAAHDAYQVDPLHLEFIARNKANWERVKVIDFI